MGKFLNALFIFCVCCGIVLLSGARAIATPFDLPDLPYSYNALEPHIDAETMQIHHDKHHAAYVNNLNKALEKYPAQQNKTLTELLSNLDQVPEDIRSAVRNNAGGHYNHSLFWTAMSPKGGGQPTGKLAEAINKSFGSFEKFQQAFEAGGASRFGSGWVWLVKVKSGDKPGVLTVTTTPNQDAPLSEGTPILGNDVWEHAYYLKYRNRRPEYLKAWWNVVNWPEISRRFAAAD
ncbi:MAG: superoxide dismutase [Thermosynechococcaceae cyanobacterium MS004]|nr:superoxide dismutase [Thermosynechococcaceae cyanobacterium MS004]